MKCKICQKQFIPLHHSQKICNSLKCKCKAKRIIQERYKKSEKGKISNEKWIKSEKRKQNEKRYKQKPRARKLAVLRVRRYREKHPEKYQEHLEKQKERKEWLTEKGKIRNRRATRRYQKTDKGKKIAKQYKYLSRNNKSGKIDWNKWEEKLELLKNECQNCGSKKQITIDHIIPLSKGGTNEISNL